MQRFYPSFLFECMYFHVESEEIPAHKERLGTGNVIL